MAVAVTATMMMMMMIMDDDDDARLLGGFRAGCAKPGWMAGCMLRGRGVAAGERRGPFLDCFSFLISFSGVGGGGGWGWWEGGVGGVGGGGGGGSFFGLFFFFFFFWGGGGGGVDGLVGW